MVGRFRATCIVIASQSIHRSHAFHRGLMILCTTTLSSKWWSSTGTMHRIQYRRELKITSARPDRLIVAEKKIGAPHRRAQQNHRVFPNKIPDCGMRGCELYAGVEDIILPLHTHTLTHTHTFMYIYIYTKYKHIHPSRYHPKGSADDGQHQEESGDILVGPTFWKHD